MEATSSAIPHQMVWDTCLAVDTDAFGDLFVRYRGAVYTTASAARPRGGRRGPHQPHVSRVPGDLAGSTTAGSGSRVSAATADRNRIETGAQQDAVRRTTGSPIPPTMSPSRSIPSSR